jgi:hypothetical protein
MDILSKMFKILKLKYTNKSIVLFKRIFSFFGEEFEDVELDGFDLSNQTLHASNVNHNQLLQVCLF